MIYDRLAIAGCNPMPFQPAHQADTNTAQFYDFVYGVPTQRYDAPRVPIGVIVGYFPQHRNHRTCNIERTVSIQFLAYSFQELVT